MPSRIHLTLIGLLMLTGLLRAEPPDELYPDEATPPHPRQAMPPTHAPTALPADALMAEDDLPPADQPFDPSRMESSERFWASGDYLLWWMRGLHLPPLATSSPTGTAQSLAGISTTVGTQSVVGDTEVDRGPRSGGRLSAGYWFGPAQQFEIDGSFFMLIRKTDSQGASSAGDPILARAFTDAQTGQPSAQLIAFPGVVSGNLNADIRSNGLFGGEINLREKVVTSGSWQFIALAGYRFLVLNEDLDINENLVATGAGAPFGLAQGSSLVLNDSFSTRNQFHGGNFGCLTQFRGNRLTLDLLTRVAVGFDHETIDINGTRQTTVPGQGTTTTQGGFLALPTNIGSMHQEKAQVIPELGVNLGYQFNERWKATAGYTLLYWPYLARPGEEVDLTINPSQLPPTSSLSGEARPNFRGQTSDLWVQGLNLGLEFRY